MFRYLNVDYNDGETPPILNAKGVSQALEKALKFEAEGYDFFKILSENATDERVRDLLAYLAKEERGHFETIDQLYSRLLPQENSAFHQRWLGDFDESGMYHTPGADVTVEGLSPSEVLESAIALEKRMEDYFLKEAEIELQQEVVRIFLILASEERTHIAKLEDLMDHIT